MEVGLENISALLTSPADSPVSRECWRGPGKAGGFSSYSEHVWRARFLRSQRPQHSVPTAHSFSSTRFLQRHNFATCLPPVHKAATTMDSCRTQPSPARLRERAASPMPGPHSTQQHLGASLGTSSAGFEALSPARHWATSPPFKSLATLFPTMGRWVFSGWSISTLKVVADPVSATPCFLGLSLTLY